MRKNSSFLRSTPPSIIFNEARMISPSLAQIENGKRLKRKGRLYQIISVILIISACITGYYSLMIYNAVISSLAQYWTVISFIGGAKLFLKGRDDVDEGAWLFEDIRIASDFSGMDGHAFNDCIVKIFRAMDYSCENLPMSGDRGADFLAEKDGVRYVVQTKRLKNKVGDSTIQKLVGAKYWYNTDGAICVTNSDYTKPAKQWETRGVELINGKRLDEIIIESQKNKASNISP